ncbi:MAG: septum formation initiator family protein [Candidatus Acidiferrales bacterium]
MTEFYTVKEIDNSRLARPAVPGRLRECCRLLALGGVLAGVFLLYAWQHFQCIQLRYQLEELKSERVQSAELNQQLKLEVAGLRSPMRIDAIARRQLGLSVPVPGQIAPVEGPSEAVLAQARAVQAAASQ